MTRLTWIILANFPSHDEINETNGSAWCITDLLYSAFYIAFCCFRSDLSDFDIWPWIPSGNVAVMFIHF